MVVGVARDRASAYAADAMTTKPAPRPMVKTRAAADRPERRSGADRRQVEEGPPGLRERRRLVEPRGPEVAEIEMTPSEWDALRQSSPLPAQTPRKR